MSLIQYIIAREQLQKAFTKLIITHVYQIVTFSYPNKTTCR